MALERTRFDGKINNKTIYDFTKQLDYDLNQKDRIELAKKILYTQHGENGDYLDPYFEKFYEQKKRKISGYKTNVSHFKVNLTKEDSLSNKNNVTQELEKIANYILFSPDGERITKKTKYNFYTEKQLERVKNKEVSIEKIVNNISKSKTEPEDFDPNIYDEVLDFLIRQGNNYKHEIKQKISKKDLDDEELKCVREYQDNIDRFKIQLDKLRNKNKDKPRQKKLMSILSSWKDDQVLCKDKIKGTIYFKQPLPDTTEIDYEQFDFFDKEHVLCLLKILPRDLTTDLGCLIYDLNKIIEECNLSDVDLKILKLYREEDSTQETIAKRLGIKQQYVSATLNKICNKIIKKFEEIYEDWYYLNICKGKYKKCSKCGEIKLVNKRYFYKHPNTKDGFEQNCKQCKN